MSSSQLPARFVNKFNRYRQQKTMKMYLQRNKVRKLQLGSGENPLPGWLNTDLEPIGDMIYLDLRQRFPFPNESFAYVFSEHSIEHISYQHGTHCFSECFRVLEKGGRVRIATPDLAFLIALYRPKKNDIQERYLTWAMETFGRSLDVRADTFVINNFFRDWGHKFIYDYETLQVALERAGFVDVQRVEVLESEDPVLRNLESHGRMIPPEFNRLETMVVEGVKP